jgi:tetratricopeptide (TPR) repeat protein
VDDELKSTLHYKRRADVSLVRAFAQHLENGELFDAALAARALGRPTEAAALFDQANHHAEAAACWQEAGDLKRSLDSAERVPRDHALYNSSARLAVEVAGQLNQVNQGFDQFVAHWVRRGPKDTHDSQVLLDLGDLYQRLGRKDDAKAVYQRLLKSTIKIEARQRLDALTFGPPVNGPPPMPSEETQGDIAARASNGSSLLDSSQVGMAALVPGATVAGRYRLEEPLGHGGTATVFRATDLALDEEVAIKLFTGPFDPEQKARFRREINLARKLSHENVLRIFELVLAEGVQGITMEYVDGVTLDVFVQDQNSSLGQRRALLVQAARAIGCAHRNNVVHRDIKPNNMLVRHDGVLKVTDFGIAKAYEDAAITMSGSFHGTPYYVSPEQIVDFKSVDHRADIYSFGVVAYEIFCGRVPFDGRTLVELLMQHTRAEPPPPRNIVPWLPVALEQLLLKLLSKRPEERVQSCDEVAEQLAAIPLG